jgi:PilZ domain
MTAEKPRRSPAHFGDVFQLGRRSDTSTPNRGPVIFPGRPAKRYGDKGMGNLRTFDRRREPRILTDLPLQVWGVDNRGERFLQSARARDISLSGALVSGLDTDLRSGDVIGILYAGRKARFRVIWVRYDEGGDKMLVAIHRLAEDACPWQDLLAAQSASESANATSAGI